MATERWLGSAVVFAIAYPVAGILFGALANPSVSNRTRIAWRLAAWFVAAAIFAAHIAYEHLRVHAPQAQAALHAAFAVAFGALLLAVWINLQPVRNAPSGRRRLALLVFPVVTGIPAYAAALAAHTFLPRRNKGE